MSTKNDELQQFGKAIETFTGWHLVSFKNPYHKESEGALPDSIGILKDEFKDFLRDNKSMLDRKGVYRFIDSNNQTYYIGDAKNLKDRLWTKARNDFNQDLAYREGETDKRRWAIWEYYENEDTIVEFAQGSELTEVVLLAAYLQGTGSLPETNSKGSRAHKSSKDAVKLFDSGKLSEELQELYDNYLA